MFTSTDERTLRTKRDIRLPVVFAVLAVCLLPADWRTTCGQEAGQPRSQIERFIPAGAILAVSTDDAAAVAKQFSATPLGGMLRAKSWEPYFAALQQTHTPCVLHLKPWFGIDWRDVSEFPTPACICLLADAKSKPAWALVVDARQRPEAAPALCDRVAAYFQGRKAVVTQEKEQDRIIYSLPAAAEGADEVVTLTRDGLVAFVTSREGADRLAAVWKSSQGASLAEAAAYRDVQQQAGTLMQPPADIRWWLRPLELVRALPAPPAKAERRRRDWRTSAEKLGIGGLQAIGGTIRLARADSARIEGALAVLAPRPFDKALRLASLRPGEWRDPPPLAAADTAVWSLSYRDVKLAFEGLGTAFDVKAGPDNEGSFRDFIDGLQADADGPQVSVRREVLPRLKPSLVQVSDLGGPRAQWNPGGRRSLMMLEIAGAADLEKVFRRWFAPDVGKRVRLETVRGHSLWAAAAGHNLFFDFKEAEELTITSLAITDTALLLSTDEAWLRSILEAKEPANPLTKDGRFAAAASYLKMHESPQTALRSYARSAALWQLPYERIQGGKSDDDDAAAQTLLALLLFGKANEIPPKLAGTLPNWRDVSPSLGTWAVSLRVSPGGFAGIIGILPANPPNAGGRQGDR
jgi:hypothetical protein